MLPHLQVLIAGGEAQPTVDRQVAPSHHSHHQWVAQEAGGDLEAEGVDLGGVAQEGDGRHEGGDQG